MFFFLVSFPLAAGYSYSINPTLPVLFIATKKLQVNTKEKRFLTAWWLTVWKVPNVSVCNNVVLSLLYGAPEGTWWGKKMIYRPHHVPSGALYFCRLTDCFFFSFFIYYNILGHVWRARITRKLKDSLEGESTCGHFSFTHIAWVKDSNSHSKALFAKCLFHLIKRLVTHWWEGGVSAAGPTCLHHRGNVFSFNAAVISVDEIVSQPSTRGKQKPAVSQCFATVTCSPKAVQKTSCGCIIRFPPVVWRWQCRNRFFSPPSSFVCYFLKATQLILGWLKKLTWSHKQMLNLTRGHQPRQQ